jgi:SNF2 family DNA or RNA helicase
MTYDPALPLYEHQGKAFDVMVERNVFALLMDMGTGKTPTILFEWGTLADAGIVLDLLVVAPASAYLNWNTEAAKHLDPEMLPRTRSAYWWSGGPAYWERAMTGFMAIRDPRMPRILLMNIEALSSNDKAYDLVAEFLSQRGAIMVIDESTKIRGHDTKRTGACIVLGRGAKLRRICTGLIAPKGPLDCYGQFAFLDERILKQKTFYGFQSRYAVMVKQNYTPAIRDKSGKAMLDENGKMLRKGPDIRQIVGWKHLDELKRLMAPWSFRVRKQDCLDLPDKVYLEPRLVPMTDEQKRVYRELLQKAIAELDSGERVTATMMITSILRRHQVLCGHAKDDLGMVRPVASNRLQVLLELLEEHKGKAIIWAPYDYCIREIIDALDREYGKGSAAGFWGGNVKDREAEEVRWRTDPDCLFMVSTQSAGGMGRTWIEADLVVYYADSYDLEHRLQSEDRAHRAGQTKKVTYVSLMCQGTIEEKIVAALGKKIDIADELNGDERREWLV